MVKTLSVAAIVPPNSTVWARVAFGEAVRASMRPPGALRVPVWSIRGPPLVASAETSLSVKSASPAGVKVKACAAPSAIWPLGVVMPPLLATDAPNSPTRPPLSVEMVPALLTDPPPPPENCRTLFRKLLLPMSIVEPMKPPRVSISPVAPMVMPFSLIRKTWPLLWIVPSISEKGAPVSTRFSVALVADGWLNVTTPAEPRLNDDQSMTARSLDWSMVSAPVTLPSMLAVPRTTEPTVGTMAEVSMTLPDRIGVEMPLSSTVSNS